MSEIIGKAFEYNEDKWMDRYKEIITTLESMSTIGITFNKDMLDDMNDVEKDVHLDAVALKIIEHELEQYAK
tara:strand:- start:3417 stop:3632 length:216 start_codon:yes stop_codon:yes gene_type:complete